MIIDADVEFLSARKVRLSWSGTDGFVAWVFLNGVLFEGPLFYDELERSFDLDVTDPFRCEVHEAAEGEPIEAISIPLVRRPIVSWSTAEGAERYLVYHKPTSVGTERVVSTLLADPDAFSVENQLRQDLRGDGGIWNFLRVEAQSARGVESVRSPFPLFVPGLPAKPTAIGVAAAGGGNFNFTLTA